MERRCTELCAACPRVKARRDAVGMGVANGAPCAFAHFRCGSPPPCCCPARPSRRRIPFESGAGMVWVNVSAAGEPAPLHFLLDSGASDSVLDLGTARRLGTKLGAVETVQGVHTRGSAWRVPAFAAEVGGAPVPSSMLAIDLAAVSAECHRHIDGLLGADFFRGRVVQIDYKAQKVRLLSHTELRAGGSAIPLASRNGALRARLPGRRPAGVDPRRYRLQQRAAMGRFACQSRATWEGDDRSRVRRRDEHLHGSATRQRAPRWGQGRPPCAADLSG